MASVMEEIFGKLPTPQVVVQVPPMQTLRCPSCGQYFSAEKSTVKEFFAKKQGLWCPNGHKLVPKQKARAKANG